MNKYLVAADLPRVLANERRIPTIVMWNRLEGRPRRPDFSRALKAEVRDPLWMITRQWQMGEFIGEDAGSPVTAKVAWNTDDVTELHSAAGTVPYDPNLPLEAMVEARPVPQSGDSRLSLGRRWRRLLQTKGHSGRVSDFLGRYPFVAPNPDDEHDFPVTAHAAAWQTVAAVAGRAIDGGALLNHLAGGGAASDGFGMVDPERTSIDDLGQAFLAWARRQYYEPDPTVATWDPKHLEYSAGLSTPQLGQAAAVAAPEYHGGRLDWFSFDAVASQAGGAALPAAPPPSVTSFLPTTAQFDGMPNTRHWAFEEGAVNFGDINPDTTDIAKLLLIEFGLVFANDWFLLPIDVPVGSLTSIRGLTVTNVFGERFWIDPAVTSAKFQNWRMFTLTPKGADDDRLFVPATTPAALESAPVEAVACVRDEVSNMVWGIETTVQLADGSSRRGREVALELHAKFQAAMPEAPPAQENDARLKYVLMTSVAEHWIPFIPVHVENDNRQIQLQRAAMPRLLKGQDGVVPDKIQPRTRLLREGLDDGKPYYVAEEEVERAGTIVETRWQRCRWRDGRVVTWLGHTRSTGRGETASGLAFDTLTPKPPR